jgi:hypothetical protein
MPVSFPIRKALNIKNNFMFLDDMPMDDKTAMDDTAAPMGGDEEKKDEEGMGGEA